MRLWERCEVAGIGVGSGSGSGVSIHGVTFERDRCEQGRTAAARARACARERL